MPAHPKLAALVAAAAVVAVAAPALAAVSVPVTVVGLGGTRQFAVEDVTGAPLTAINLGTGGSQPFRTHVTDTAFLPSASGGNYDVTATLSNLYLKTGAGSTAADYNFNVKVPSSAAQIGFGSNPLAVTGLSITDLPQLSLAGTLTACTAATGPLQSVLGLSALATLTNSALANLCSTIGSSSAPVTATVDAALQTITSTLTDVTKLPTALSGATGGTFTNPSYATGVGALDTAGATAAAGTAATSLSLMKGTTASSLDPAFATDLLTQITALLTGPLTSTTGVGTQTQLASVISELQASSTPVLAQLGALLNTLSAADQSTLINSIFTTVTPVLPVLADVQGVTGSSYAFPILSATPTTPTAGTYGGTMTVTFVQS